MQGISTDVEDSGETNMVFGLGNRGVSFLDATQPLTATRPRTRSCERSCGDIRRRRKHRLQGGVDIIDAHSGRLRLRVMLPEPIAMLSADVLHGKFLAID